MTLDRIRYAIAELRSHYDDQIWWKKRIAQRIVGPIHSVYPGHDGIHVMEADWDNLVVLDACRADLFEEVVDRGQFDEYQRVTSQASMTAEWAEKNFSGGHFGNTVYITANPYVSEIAGNCFHDVVNVWETAFDEELGTVRPEPVREAAMQAKENYPNKRLIIHFMQPHYPFIGYPSLTYDSWSPEQIQGKESAERNGPHSVWQALELGLVDHKTVWDGYADNLRAVIPSLEVLLETIDGRSIITSDHGNLVGERLWPLPMRFYGHPRGIRTKELVNVPWAVVEGKRRQIVEEGTNVTEPTEDVSERLRDLGYA